MTAGRAEAIPPAPENAGIPDFIRAEELRYAYRKGGAPWVLNGIDLAVRPDAYLLVAGASGSGKSTLCRTFNGLIPHFYGGVLEGRVVVGGRDTAGLSVGALFGQVGMVFQNPEAQLFNRTVEGEIAFGLESLGLPRRTMKARIGAVSRAMGISDLLNRDPHSLSGGEQQLTCLAAILALAPTAVVLDEPYASLDPANVWRVRKALRDIHGRGTGVIVAEHRMGYTAPDAGRMVVIDNGRVVLDGPPSRLLTPIATETFGLTGGSDLAVAASAASSAVSPSVSAAETVLAAEDLSHAMDGGPILKNIHFSLRKGECAALLGANGAGKTTLLKHFNGLLRPTGGRLVFNGRDIRDLPVSRLARQVGMAFQNPSSQFFKLSVKEEILAGPRALECVDEAWIDRLIRLFRLEPLLERPPFRLSGGEKKRVAFAAALAAQPEVLALDEPTAGQDGHFRKALGGFLSDLRSLGRSVVFATHDLAFAARNARRWVVMGEGGILADGSSRDILADPALMEKAGLRPPEGEGAGV